MSTLLSFLTSDELQLERMVEDFRALDREIKRLVQESAFLKAKIIQRIGSDESIHNRQGHVIATYRKYEREDFDKLTFAENCPELYELYLKKSSIKRFCLK